MIALTKQAGKKVGIFGLGKTGISVCKALEKHAQIICFDDSEKNRENFLQIMTKDTLLSLASDEWKELGLIIVSPGVPPSHPIFMIAKENNIPVKGDIELMMEEFPEANYIGITGTNGKSTTVKMIAHILTELNIPNQYGGNIGIPCLELTPPKKDENIILELSSYQLDLIQRSRLNIAAILNITPDHIDRYGSIARYIKSKKQIFHNSPLLQHLVIRDNNTYTQEVLRELNNQQTSFTTHIMASKDNNEPNS